MASLASVSSRRLETRVRNHGGTIIISAGERVLELSEVAGLVWRLLDGRRTVRQVSELVAREYDVDVPTVAADVAEVVAELASANMITLRQRPIHFGFPGATPVSLIACVSSWSVYVGNVSTIRPSSGRTCPTRAFTSTRCSSEEIWRNRAYSRVDSRSVTVVSSA